MMINVVLEPWNMFRTLGMVTLTLVGSSAKLGGDSRRNNARQIESVGWEESRSQAFSWISP